jgi:hypothetical protein
MIIITKLPITQHKRFALRAHPNFCFAKTSFTLGTLGEEAIYKHEEW